MKIFITGGSGFLGKNILRLLPEYKYAMFNRGENIIEQLDKFKPDIIIHCAAELYLEELMYQSNIILTGNILDWVGKNNVKLIYFGSSSEYGKIDVPMNETHKCNPTFYYAATKLWGTHKCIEKSVISNRDICVLRPFSVYGPGEPARRLIPTIINSVKTKTPLKVIRGHHDFIHIDDFVRLLSMIISSNNTKGQIFNGGSGVSHTNKEITYKIFDMLGDDTEVEFLDTVNNRDSEVWTCDTTKIFNFFGFSCIHSIDNGLLSVKV